MNNLDTVCIRFRNNDIDTVSCAMLSDDSGWQKGAGYDKLKISDADKKWLIDAWARWKTDNKIPPIS